MKRFYTYTCYRHGGRPDSELRWCESNARIREVSMRLFRSWFGGRIPDRLCWHKDGQMAVCEDRRGNRIIVDQHNDGDPEVIRCAEEARKSESKRWWLAIAPAQGRAAA